MHLRNILLILTAILLSGCQPEAPKTAQPDVPPATTQPAAPPTAANIAAQPAREAAVPAMKGEPADETKAVSAPEKLPVAETALPVPSNETAAPVAKTEPAVAVAAPPEAKPAPAVSEADAMPLIKKNNCFACHAANKKIVGPSFRDIATKYRGDAGAEARMADKIAKGGSGVWGVMVMPPGPHIGEADRRIMAAYILSLK